MKAYLKLGFSGREVPPDLDRLSAGQMVNPIKTMQADADNIYVALTPAVTDSTLVHQLAHVLDYLAGSKSNPAIAKPLSMELELPLELIEHPKEFGDWLQFLKGELKVELDAEDAIVDYLAEIGRLLPGELINSDDYAAIKAQAHRTLKYVHEHREEIDQRIKNLAGYQGPEKTGG